MRFKENIEAAIEHVQKELTGIRSGRAVPALVEEVRVDAYGAPTTLKQVASITVPEPRVLAITPWDKSLLPAVGKALEQADLGAMPVTHGDTIHVTLPSLTTERREKLIKLVGQAIEEGKIALRRHREDALAETKKQKDSGELSEDGFFRTKGAIDEQMKTANEKLEKIRAAKEEELQVN